MVFMPPGSAKSTYASILAPAWMIGRNGKRSIIAASHTATLAERFGRKVRNLVGAAEYAEIFKTRLAPDSMAAARWATQDGGEYLASGVGAAIVGFRADIAIIDDPIAGREQADSETEREKTYQWYLNDLWTRLKPGAAVVLIMQRWHEDDLAGRLLRDMEAGGERWEIVKLRMEAESDDPLGREPGEPLWPEWFTDGMRDQAKRDVRSWSALYQQDPVPVGGGEIKADWFQRYRKTEDDGKGLRYILVDPAGERKPGRKGRKDNTAMGVFETRADGNVYLLDGVRERIGLIERTDILFEWVAKYKPQLVGYEQYGMQSDSAHIQDRMERDQYRFRLIELGGSLRKEDRIRRVIPRLERGGLWFPTQLMRTAADGTRYDLMANVIDQEVKGFPVAPYDDFLDMLSRLEDLEEQRLLKFPMIEKTKLKTTAGRGPSGSSWMAA